MPLRSHPVFDDRPNVLLQNNCRFISIWNNDNHDYQYYSMYNYDNSYPITYHRWRKAVEENQWFWFNQNCITDDISKEYRPNLFTIFTTYHSPLWTPYSYLRLNKKGCAGPKCKVVNNLSSYVKMTCDMENSMFVRWEDGIQMRVKTGKMQSKTCVIVISGRNGVFFGVICYCDVNNFLRGLKSQ